ncbi:MAG: hypothetical protein ACYTG5_19965 [Planctomycetota bacterium]
MKFHVVSPDEQIDHARKGEHLLATFELEEACIADTHRSPRQEHLVIFLELHQDLTRRDVTDSDAQRISRSRQ